MSATPQNPQTFQVRIGARSIKSAAAATLCATLYFLFDQNPTFACIGAIFGIGRDMQNSWLNGGNRLIGTVIGGILGMGLFKIYLLIYPKGDYHLILLPLLFVGVVLLILSGQILKWPGAIQPGAVVLCIILFNTPPDSYVAYSLHRMLDTGIGVAVALIVNLILPREPLQNLISKLKLHA